MRECKGRFLGRGRYFRIRREEHAYGKTEFAKHEIVVDISKLYKQSDRWANSIEETIKLEESIRRYEK